MCPVLYDVWVGIGHLSLVDKTVLELLKWEVDKI